MRPNAADATALGLPDQRDGMPTMPTDRGDETQDRFRYQWAMGVVLLAQAMKSQPVITSLWCEHHDDFLIELSSGNFLAVQVKTDGSENARWTVIDTAFIESIARFCLLETCHGERIEQYHFCSNAGVHIPGATAESEKNLMSSPMRLREACKQASAPSAVQEPYATAFKQLAAKAQVEHGILFCVVRKLIFRRGPPLRGYLDTLVAKVVPVLPGCSSLPAKNLRLVRDELMRLVETASGIPTGGLDGVLAYIEANGRPSTSIRGKCITLESARACVDNARQAAFRYVGVGEGLPLGNVGGQRDVLHRKMRNAYIDGQFESLWSRSLSAESRLMARALANADDFDEFANQLEGAVLTECKDVEALAEIESDERKRGPLIYRTILQRLSDLAANEPAKVENEPKDTLLGVAGMLSGSCRFAWGVPLDDEEGGDVNGA
jgi:hypothetical protein